MARRLRTSVVIERVCSGLRTREGYTDSKGYFSIQLGAQNNGVMITTPVKT